MWVCSCVYVYVCVLNSHHGCGHASVYDARVATHVTAQLPRGNDTEGCESGLIWRLNRLDLG